MMETDNQKSALKKYILKEQFEVYWNYCTCTIIRLLIDEMKIYNWATITTEFEMSLSVAMGITPYGGDPTSSIGEKLYKEWRKAGAERFSPAIMALRNKSVRSFVDEVSYGDMIDERMTSGEERIVHDTIFQDDAPSISKLFMGEILNLVDHSKMKNRTKMIDQFLSYWGKWLLIPQDAEKLENLSEFMQGNFEEFIKGNRKLTGFSDVKSQILAEVLREQKISYEK